MIASNHDGAGHEFSVGWEAGAFVEDVLAGANRDMKEAKELLSRAFEQQARAVDAIATQVEKDSGWKFMGLDPTPAPLAFGKARLTDRRAGRRWLFCREECKQRDSNHAKDHNVLGAILPVHPVRHGLRRHDCHREPMGKA